MSGPGSSPPSHFAARLWSVLILVALLFGTLLFATFPPGSWAAETGTIDGRLVNRTASGQTPTGEVGLVVYRSGSVIEEKRATPDSEGRFAFDSLVVEPALTYQVAVEHAGALYASDPIVLNTSSPRAEIELAVYEAIGSEPGLRASLVLLMLGNVDEARQVVEATETVRLTNPTDRTFVPGIDGVTGPNALVRFSLPDALVEFVPTAGLDWESLTQIDGGFASFLPIYPGSQEVSYRYAFSYSDSRTIEKSLPYGAEIIYVMSAEDGPSVESDDLTPGERILFQGTSYRVWTTRDVPPGSRLTIDLVDLPARPIWNAALDALLSPGVLPVLLGVILALSIVWQLRRTPRARPTGSEG